MGTNLFVEGKPAPVVIRATFPRRVNDSKGLKEVAEGLRLIDEYLHEEWKRDWDNFNLHKRGDIEVRLLNFRVSSPPTVEIFSDPAWLAVLLTVLANYDDIKDNVPKLVADISSIPAVITGLTQRQFQLLEIAVRLSLGNLAERGAEESERMARKFRRVRKYLLGDDEDADVQIEVFDVENKRRPG